MNNYYDQGNRLNYGALLCPDSGYKLSFAVGCTYSLDFEALVSIPLYLCGVEQTSSERINNPFVILENICRSTDKIALFCNCDGIKMLRNIKPVYALLDNSVFPVNLGNGSNFHPKLWVIRYDSQNDGPDMIKVLVLSRNLTFDRSMDLVVEMKGYIGKRIRRNSKQKPIADLLNFLASTCDTGDKAERIKTVADDLLRVDSFEIANDFEDYSFLVTGIPNHDNDSKEICSPCRRIMVVSPFLSKSVLSNMVRDCYRFENNQQVNRILISRLTSVTPEVFSLFDEVYTPAEGLENNALLQENDEDEPKRDLHAKVIFKDTYTENAIYIGSFNTTANAKYKNVEIMVKLKYKPYKSSLRLLREQFVESTYPAFQRLLSPLVETADEDETEEMVDFSDVIESIIEAAVRLDSNGSYSTIVRFKCANADVLISPLFIDGDLRFKEASPEVVFDHMTTKELSELFVVKKNDESRIIKLNISDLPFDERNDAIFRDMLNTRPKFLQYILFLLSDDLELASMEINQLMKDGFDKNNDENGTESLITPSIYERMLLAAARDPERIKSIRDAVKHFDDEKIDKEFIDLVNSFDSLIGE